ncbi:MAG: hypothetical protein O7I42_14245 [Alphaproteobacteria bacterium]|nr:hypothetical protein [Alphaproteobacteria bacterium]
MKLLREPLVHFMFIGAAIYLLYGIFAEPVSEEVENTIVVSAGEIEWLQTAWQKRWYRLPTAEERDGLIQQYIRETVLYREALTMGLDKDDIVVRRRLAQKLEFLAQDLAALTPPSEEELQAYSPSTGNVTRNQYALPLHRSLSTRTSAATRRLIMLKGSRRH